MPTFKDFLWVEGFMPFAELLQSAESGMTGAQLCLSDLKFNNCSPHYDPSDAEKWLKRSAEGGHRIAQYQLGERLIKRAKTDADFAEAFEWIKLASAQGWLPISSKIGQESLCDMGVTKKRLTALLGPSIPLKIANGAQVDRRSPAPS